MIITTTYNPPPIPIRDYDWRATVSRFTTATTPGWIAPDFDGNGENAPTGYGASELDALENLIAKINDNDNDND